MNELEVLRAKVAMLEEQLRVAQEVIWLALTKEEGL